MWHTILNELMQHLQVLSERINEHGRGVAILEHWNNFTVDGHGNQTHYFTIVKLVELASGKVNVFIVTLPEHEAIDWCTAEHMGRTDMSGTVQDVDDLKTLITILRWTGLHMYGTELCRELDKA